MKQFWKQRNPSSTCIQVSFETNCYTWNRTSAYKLILYFSVGVTLSYIDDDGDRVEIMNDEDVEEAKHVHAHQHRSALSCYVRKV